MRDGQSAIETIIIFSISTLIILVLLNSGLNVQSSASDSLRISQARATVNEITNAADELWSQGPGASTKVIITIPESINDSESGIIGDRTVRYRVLTVGDYTDVSEVSSANLTGFLPKTPGNYEITLIVIDNSVLVLSELFIDDCQASDINLSYGDSSYLACRSASPDNVEIVIFTISGTNYTASKEENYWWNQTINCGSSTNYSWTLAWVNDSSSNSVSDNPNIVIVCNPTIINQTIFYEDFTPIDYYNYNWTEVGNCWDFASGTDCYDQDCAHADGPNCDENDYVQTNNGLINLSGSNNVYATFWITENSGFDTGEYLRVWCYNGVTWQTFLEDEANDWTDGTYTYYNTIVPSACWLSNSRFRITIQASHPHEDFHIDDFTILKEIST